MDKQKGSSYMIFIYKKYLTHIMSRETYLCLLVYAHVLVSGENETDGKCFIKETEL